LIYTFIDGRTKSYLFLFIFTIFMLINHFLAKSFTNNRKFFLAIFILFVLSVVLNKKYSVFYSHLQQYPRIYSISSNWSIQGMPITIEGKNFGPVHEKGQVVVGDLSFEIESWSERKIVAIQPVPSSFFVDKLQVIAFNGKKSNEIDFKIRDPKEINNE
jgi:hypothetical protein